MALGLLPAHGDAKRTRETKIAQLELAFAVDQQILRLEITKEGRQRVAIASDDWRIDGARQNTRCSPMQHAVLVTVGDASQQLIQKRLQRRQTVSKPG